MTVNSLEVNFDQSVHPNLQGLDAQTGAHVPQSQYGLNESPSFSPSADLSLYRASNSGLADFSNYEPYQGVRERRWSDSSNNSDDLTGFSNKQVVDAVSESTTPGSGTPAPDTFGSATPATTDNAFIQRVVDLTNDQRSQAGLQPLQLNQKLDNAAESHSEDMALHHYFRHTGLDGSSAGDRAKAAGYQFSYFGENIAAGYATPQDVVQGWMNSPGHRANILNPNFQEIGVGYYLANDPGNYHSYWTEDFGTLLNV